MHEKITTCTLPAGSEWLNVGTERGNILFIRARDFVTSTFTVYWNHTAGGDYKEHPGPVQFLHPCPQVVPQSEVLLILTAVFSWQCRSQPRC